MYHRPMHSRDPFLSVLFIAVGAIMLLYVALHFAPWIFLSVFGYKILSLGLRMKGMPPLFFLFSRWF